VFPDDTKKESQNHAHAHVVLKTTYPIMMLACLYSHARLRPSSPVPRATDPLPIGRGFYCANNLATGRWSNCFPEAYTLIATTANCASESGGTSWTWPLIVVLPAVTVLVLVLACAVACDGGRRADDDSDRLLRAEVAALRARLRIMQADGFLLEMDRHSPWWWQWLWSGAGGGTRAGGLVYLQRSGLEAAARLAMWQARGNRDKQARGNRDKNGAL
jgi:hypothetical protein